MLAIALAAGFFAGVVLMAALAAGSDADDHVQQLADRERLVDRCHAIAPTPDDHPLARRLP